MLHNTKSVNLPEISVIQTRIMVLTRKDKLAGSKNPKKKKFYAPVRNSERKRKNDEQTVTQGKKFKNGIQPSMTSPVKLKVVEGRLMFDHRKNQDSNVNSTKSAQNKNQNRTIRAADKKISQPESSSAKRGGKADQRIVQQNTPERYQAELEAEGMTLYVDAEEEEEFIQDYDEDSELEEGQIDNDDEVDPESHQKQAEVVVENFETMSTADTEVELNIKSSEITQDEEQVALQLLASNPHLGNLFKRMIKDGIEEEKRNERRLAETG